MKCVFFVMFICVCIICSIYVDRKKQKAITCQNMNKLSTNVIIQEIEKKIKNRAKNCDNFYEKYSIKIKKPEECVIEYFRKRGFTVTEVDDNYNIIISWENVK